MKPPKPCIARLDNGLGCPNYVEGNGARCEHHRRLAMKDGTKSPGTTAAWARARKIALERAGYTCEACGRTDAQSRAEGLGGLHVHHLVGNIRTEPHDVDQLEVRCQPCHTGLVKKTTRQTWPERQEFLKQRAKTHPIGSDW